MSTMASLLLQINHFVVVMLENRSFDHMLGFLYGPGNPAPRGQAFEGLTGNEANLDANGKPVKVFKIPGGNANTYFWPGANPGEGYLNTNFQLFGTKNAPVPVVASQSQGFVKNFADTLPWDKAQKDQSVVPGTTANNIMGMYTPDLLPVLSGLATGYAVCDHWYSSAPTETFPNRAFLAMATSQGFVKDRSRSLFTAPSIFTLLSKNGRTWAIYGYDQQPKERGSVADIASAPASNFGLFSDFQAAVKKGTLANYVFLEPSWGAKGNSQHPNYDVSLGEQFLLEIYQTLYGSSVWDETLLVITYDEHGGCYDHVPPPDNAVAPDDSAGEEGFDFKRFGVRVPTVLVSPLIPAGTVYRAPGTTPFDHTSILATVEHRYGLPSLTLRDAAAPDVSGVLTLAQARKDDPLSAVKAPRSGGLPTALPKAPDHLEMALAANAANLPVPDVVGNAFHHTMPQLGTSREVRKYVKNRYHDYEQQEKKRRK